jgi:hypothetical protein
MYPLTRRNLSWSLLTVAFRDTCGLNSNGLRLVSRPERSFGKSSAAHSMALASPTRQSHRFDCRSRGLLARLPWALGCDQVLQVSRFGCPCSGGGDTSVESFATRHDGDRDPSVPSPSVIRISPNRSNKYARRQLGQARLSADDGRRPRRARSRRGVVTALPSRLMIAVQRQDQ